MKICWRLDVQIVTDIFTSYWHNDVIQFVLLCGAQIGSFPGLNLTPDLLGPL